MKASPISDQPNVSRAAAHQPATNGIAAPDVTSRQPLQEDHAAPEAEEPVTAPLAIPVMLDMDDDEEEEPHTLFIDQNDGTLWLHSDTQTLKVFLDRKRKKPVVSGSANLIALLNAIEVAAQIVHTGRYGTVKPVNRVNSKGKQKTTQRAGPTAQERLDARAQLKVIDGLLQQLNRESALVMKKQRPPSHKEQVDTRNIDGDLFCAKVVMAPLSVLLRDDGVFGSQPSATSTLFTSLTARIAYKRGHMLNEHLHGPGTGNNLVPISTAFNSVMKTGVEKAAKEAVNANNKVIRFEAEPLDWGKYPGFYKGKFPDEQKLPNRFRFLVKQMLRKPGTDGSKIAHWEDTGPVLYSKTETHTIPSPADVVQGTVAPGVKTFKPGYYRSYNGKLEQAANLNYHLFGSYIVNGPTFAHFFEPFGLDPAGLIHEDLPLNVTTEFELPPGLSLIVIPQGEVECVANGKVHKVATPSGCSFVIADISTRNHLLATYAGMIRDMKIAQQKSDQLALKQKQQELQDRKKSSAEEARNAEAGKNSHRIVILEMTYNSTADKYASLFKGVFQQRFNAMREDILANAKAAWGRNDKLYGGSADYQLQPHIALLEKEVNQLVQEQTTEAARERAARGREELVSGLLQELSETTTNQYRNVLPERWQRAEFDKGAEDIFGVYKRYWQDPKNRFDKSQRQEMLDSALKKMAALHEKTAAKTSPAESSKRKFEPPTEKKTASLAEKEKDSGDEQGERKKFKSDPDAFRLNANTSGAPQLRQPDIPPFQPPRQISEREAADTANTVFQWIINLQQQFNGDQVAQGQLATLHEPLQQFMARPNPGDWKRVSAILNQLLSIGALRDHLLKPYLAWESIKPR